MISKSIIEIHPCFSDESNKKYGRLHLPVSPNCNIQCRFCKRAFNKTENRPGVANGILKLEDVEGTVERALKLCSEITVIGIAGPGESLSSDYAISAFSLVHKKYPHLIKCLSTNGLLLADKVSQLEAVGVTTLTVTVNAINPKILSKIVSYIKFNDTFYTGETAAEILISKQLEGIKKASEIACVKVNSVLIPGINDNHIAEIASAIKQSGASIYNIIPLIPQYEFQDMLPPDCNSITKAKKSAEQYIKLFNHCNHCRADACGIPGKNDFSAQIYANQLETFSHG